MPAAPNCAIPKKMSGARPRRVSCWARQPVGTGRSTTWIGGGGAFRRPAARPERGWAEEGRQKTPTRFGGGVDFLESGRYGAYELPSKLFARRHENVPGIGLNHVTLEVRVVIERWALPGE